MRKRLRYRIIWPVSRVRDSTAAGSATALPSGVHGHADPAFGRVVAEFAKNLRERGELGGAFSAVVDGRRVVDIWGGTANRSQATAWTSGTLAPLYSGTKGLVAVCLLLLIERGQLDLDTPVAFYWPEFGQNGKDQILVREVVSHRAGLPGLTTAVSAEEATDDHRMARLLAEQAPATRPGEFHYYHAVTFGWLCGELIRRVDGRSVGHFLAEEVVRPLEIEAWIGLPSRYEPRVARVESDGDFGTFDATTAPPGSIEWSIWRNPPRYSAGDLAANLPLWHAAEIPGTSGIGSARALARLYGCLARGGSIDDVTLLSTSTIELGTRCLARGYEPVLATDVAFGVGFQLQTDALALGPPGDAFGHGGAGGSIHGAWPSLGVGFSYCTNLLMTLGAGDVRAKALLDALHADVTATR